VIETTSAPPFGSAGIIVGYGRSGDPLFDYGIKRAGAVVTASCASIPSPGSNTTSVCWDFTSPLGPPGTDSNTCNADSGGPLFVDLGSGLAIAGVTSGGSSASCNPTDHSYDANVFTYRSFIETEGGADLSNTRCGLGPQVGEPGATVLTTNGTLNSGNPDDTFSFTVPNGTETLRVAMNAIDDGSSDFDLYVRQGSPPTTSTHDCGRSGSGQFGVCSFADPTPGTWYMLVNRWAGSGTYQLTVTEFGGVCGAGSDGNPCDDDNPCTTSDVCASGTCAGTPVGNGTPCNDGNTCTSPDTCQSGTCSGTVLPNGTACDDGNPCSRPDTCQAGTCNGTLPAVGCKSAPAGAALLAIDNRSPDSRDRFAWTLRKGAATSIADFGNPTTTTPYTLCLYDDVGGSPQPRISQAIPAGSRWKAFSRGFRYRDTTLSAGGLGSITLTSGAAGRSSVQVRGHGEPLALPNLPFTKQPSVVVQLLNPNTCWSSTYSTALDNGIARFKAKND
jgi:pre-peptidase